MKVYFSNVGNDNRAWAAECKGELTHEWLYKQIKPFVKSRKIGFCYDEQSGLGLIFGGLYTIGGFRIER